MTDEIRAMQQDLNSTIEDLSEKHRMHRKIRFLLDVRGLLIINKLKGCYAEFGVYRGEMMYAATQILKDNISTYFGFDTFEGLPNPSNNDEEIFVFEKKGFMECPKDFVGNLLSEHPNKLIAGDFRKEEVITEISKELEPISILSLDCNWPSSIEAALETAAPKLQAGSIVFFDDYFVGTRAGDYTKPIMEKIGEKHGLNFIYFQTYPPCARAFIVEKVS